jgi:hypothetical protein
VVADAASDDAATVGAGRSERWVRAELCERKVIAPSMSSSMGTMTTPVVTASPPSTALAATEAAREGGGGGACEEWSEPSEEREGRRAGSGEGRYSSSGRTDGELGAEPRMPRPMESERRRPRREKGAASSAESPMAWARDEVWTETTVQPPSTCWMTSSTAFQSTRSHVPTASMAFSLIRSTPRPMETMSRDSARRSLVSSSVWMAVLSSVVEMSAEDGYLS